MEYIIISSAYGNALSHRIEWFLISLKYHAQHTESHISTHPTESLYFLTFSLIAKSDLCFTLSEIAMRQMQAYDCYIKAQYYFENILDNKSDRDRLYLCSFEQFFFGHKTKLKTYMYLCTDVFMTYEFYIVNCYTIFRIRKVKYRAYVSQNDLL